jgi:hypothetical protein
LNTTHCLASALARSLVVSVLPVPAGLQGHTQATQAEQRLTWQA